MTLGSDYMTTKKIRVGILCGGKSGEHEVSLQSAKNIVEAIDREKYEVIVIGIDKDGQWALFESDHFFSIDVFRHKQVLGRQSHSAVYNSSPFLSIII